MRPEDLRTPRGVYSSTISRGSSFSAKRTFRLLGLADPKIMTFDLEAFSLYLQLLEYVYTISSIFCSSSGEEAIRARSSAYAGAPQYVSPILAPRLAFTWLKMASTEKRKWRCLERNKERFKTAKSVCSIQKESIKCSIDCLDSLS